MSAPVTMAAAAAAPTAAATPARSGRPGGDADGFEQALRAQAGPADPAAAPETGAQDGSRPDGDTPDGSQSAEAPTDASVPVVDAAVVASVVAPLLAPTPTVQEPTNVSLGGRGEAPAGVQEPTNVSGVGRGGAPAGVQESTNVSLVGPGEAPAAVQESTNVSLVVAGAKDDASAEGQELTNVSLPARGAGAGPDAVSGAASQAGPLPAGTLPVTAADAVAATVTDPGMPVAALQGAPVAAPVAPPATVQAPAAAAPAAPPVPVHSQVVTAVTPLLRGPDGTHELTLRLDPDGLGAVHVRLSVSGDEVRMHLTAVDAGTREALRDGIAQLRSSLEDVGLRATALDVGTGADPRQWSGPGTDAQQRPRPADLPSGRNGPAPPDPSAQPRPGPPDHRPDTRLDLRM
ncbi:flagellar hook-length control protein FliK [Phycicoccus avicenniae]|uniref:flagellar hook-length control protein FliK n=1 Tax=Phycicoccus avicenniae TaxID=2828860 RepID=UPI003D2A10D3